MADQKHLIKRQTFELTVQDPAEARRFQNELSRIYRQRIVPLIDRYCTELSQPDQLYRIESLEVDLGFVDPGQFETDLVAKLEPALRQALADTIGRQEQNARRQGQSPKTASELELFAFFARTGSLPWWAEATRPQLLEECLGYLLETAPEALRRLVRSLGRERQAVRRLVQHYPDEQLARLAGLLVPPLASLFSGDAQELIGVLSKTGVAAGKQPAQLQRSFWTNILQIAAVEGAPAGLEPFYRAVLTRLAAELGLTYRTLITNIRQAIQKEGEKLSLEFKETFARLYEALPGHSDEPDLSRQLTQLPAAGGPLAELEAVLRVLVPRFPARLQKELTTALKELAGGAPSSIQVPSESVQRLLRLIQSGLSPQGLLQLTLPERRRLLAALQALASSKLSSGEVAELTQMLGEIVSRDTVSSLEADEESVDLSFSDADELYLGNAGLVILWPFLSHFFARLELLAGQAFKDAAARQRAVGLLQYVATAEPTFPEYLLPLNKVLCGLDLAEVFEFGPSLSEPEADECTNLLTAVIQQAPILRDMSVDGFRGTFLLRPGVLSSRDGAWLLRVERETYDVVLDRFPWGWEWVKLPWMEAPLRVEW